MAGIKRVYRTEKAYLVILTAAAFFMLMTLFFLIEGRHYAAEEYGGTMKMTKQMKTMSGDIPLIDRNAPSVTETATFALG